MESSYSVCLYGTSAAGFTYLLAVAGGPLVATEGRGSDFGASGRGTPCQTKGEAVACALKFVPEGAAVCVHEPGTGRVRVSGWACGGVVVSAADREVASDARA